MVDSHVLVGSCAQVGARVHLSAGVTIGGVLEPAGARPVIVEDGAFVGAGELAARGRAGRRRGGDRRRRGPDGDLAPVRPRPRTGPDRHAGRRRSRSRPGPSSCPGTRTLDGAVRARSTAWPSRSRCWSRTATPGPTPGSRSRRRCDEPGRRAGSAAGPTGGAAGPPRSPAGTQRDPPRRPARRPRPRGARRLASARRSTPTTSTSSRRQVEALRRRLPPSVDLAYAVKANPQLAVLRHLAGLGLGADVASGGELRARPARRVRAGPRRRHRPRQARRGARRRRRRRASAP